MERSESIDNTCAVCHENFDIYAIGPCDHPICYRCSTRMRVLCEQQDCPICRSTMPQVALVHQRAYFKDINLRDCIPNRRNKMFYADEIAETKYLDLLEFRCRLCPTRKPDRSFSSLQTHMRREHQLFACDLCLTHLKIFPFERKFYDRKRLATHRRVGDADDTSYKGHPLCEFCDTRYNDKDELLRHLRKDHYFCHFCDTQGCNAYYDQYPDLRNHFSESHFLCTEDDCGQSVTQFTHAFASEIDLKAHKATAHNRNMSRAQTREARTLEVDFHLPPRRQGHGRPREDTGSTYKSYRDHGQGNDYYSSRRHNREDQDLQRAIEASKESAQAPEATHVQEELPDPVRDFPTLSGAPAPITILRESTERKPREEDFPSLSVSSKSSGKGSKQQVSLKQYASVMNYQPQPKAVTQPKKTESKPVSLGHVSSASKDRWSKPVPDVTEDSYPVLIKSDRSLSNFVSSHGWYQSSQSKNEAENSVNSNVSIISSKPAESDIQEDRKKSKFNLREVMESENDFPTLGGGRRSPDEGAFGNPTWGKQTGKKNNPPALPKKKVGDDSFELPESYFKAYNEDPVPSKSVDNSPGNSLSSVLKDKVKISAKKPDIKHPKEFPGLPSSIKKTDPPDEKKKKAKSKTKKPNNIPKNKETDQTNDSRASLNDIAFTLMGPGIIEKGKENAKNTEKQKKTKESKKTGSMADIGRTLDSKHGDSNHLAREKTTPKSVNNIESGAKSSAMNEDSSMKQTSVTLNENFIDNNFPSLHSMSTPIQKTRPPPGFVSDPPQAGVPPPGVPPPGFSSVQVSSQSLASNFPLLSEYVQPPEFKSRNLDLIKEIRNCVDHVEDGFVNFKTLSGQFRQGVLEASDYYFSCQSLMGEAKFSKIFPELLVLLPDIKKQQELWNIYQLVDLGSPLSHIPTTKSPIVCHLCGQVVLKQDVHHHNSHHENNNSDFPALNGNSKNTATSSANGSRPGLSVKGAWITAK